MFYNSLHSNKALKIIPLVCFGNVETIDFTDGFSLVRIQSHPIMSEQSQGEAADFCSSRNLSANS